MRPGMTWPDGAWAFSKFMRVPTIRRLAAVLLALAALGFVLAGIGLLMKQGWFQPVTVGTAIFSSVVYLLCWDGKFKGLDEKGGLGLLLNLAFLFVAIFVKLAF